MLHGQRVNGSPGAARQAGFDVVDVPERHFCCGSAGTYESCCSRILPARSASARPRISTASIADMVAAGNLGCMVQIATLREGAGRSHCRVAGLGDRRAHAARIAWQAVAQAGAACRAV